MPEVAQTYKFPFPTPSWELAAKGMLPPPEALDLLDAELSAFEDELDRAALDPTLWVDILKRLAKCFDSTCANVALFDFASGRYLLHSIASEHFEIPYALLEAYELSAPFDPRAQLCMNFPGRTITHEDIDPEKLKQLPVVQMAPDELAQMMTLNDIADPYWGFLSVLRDKAAPAFTRFERARLTGLAPALSRSMKLFRESEAQALEGRQIQRDLLDQFSFPAALFAADGICVGLNAKGKERLKLQKVSDWPSPFGWSSLCREASQLGMAEVNLATPTGPTPARLARLNGIHPLLLLEIDIDPDSPIMKADRFCLEHNFSKAEREVLHLLIGAHSLNTIADMRQTSIETIRSQLRSMREKSGLSTQSELVAAVARFGRLTT